MKLQDLIADRLFGRLIRSRVAEAVKVVDEQWWRQISDAARPRERPWHEVRTGLDEALEAWRTNPLAFRIVSLTTDFVVGRGLRVRSSVPWVEELLQRFWQHRLNRLDLRLHRWCDELTRSGELFLVLSTNPGDGLSYVRELPAVRVDRIETSADDLERELRYHELTSDLDGRWWPGPAAAEALSAPQLVLHYSINRPVGSLRGQGDLAPILPWLKHYRLWLEDRVRVNRFKSAFLWHVSIADPGPGVLERRRAQCMQSPEPGSVIVTDQKEEWKAVQPAIQAADAWPDGRAMRLLIAAGAGIPLHFLAEGESATRATAREMGTPTYRHYAQRRRQFCDMLLDLCTWMLRRAQARGRGGTDSEYGLECEAMDEDDV
ncbi:MAG: hypothetical protein ACUVX9_12830 [Anaerolineae bacterium]